jgi:uncharacterized protein YhfF
MNVTRNPFGILTFGDSLEMGTELADLVLAGIKRSTTNFALLAASLPIPRPGDFVPCLAASVIHGSSGEPAG